MPATPHKLEFFFEGMPVGYVEEGRFPTSAGRYRYMLYRGLGHYRMQAARRAGARTRCTSAARGRAVSFQVVDCPEYGLLDLMDFVAADLA